MDFNKALELLNLEKTDNVVPISLIFKEKPSDSQWDFVTLSYAKLAIREHENSLTALVEASKEGIIGGTQWYHRQHVEAWTIISEYLQFESWSKISKIFGDTDGRTEHPETLMFERFINTDASHIPTPCIDGCRSCPDDVLYWDAEYATSLERLKVEEFVDSNGMTAWATMEDDSIARDVIDLEFVKDSLEWATECQQEASAQGSTESWNSWHQIKHDWRVIGDKMQNKW